MSNEKEPRPGRLRIWLTEGFNHAEDIVYIGLGLLLTATAFALLAAEILYFGRYVFAGTLQENIVFCSPGFC